MELIKIGQFIKKRRKELNLSQNDIAEALFVTVPTVSKWENNGRLPDISIFSSLAKILKVDLESFLKGESKLNNNYDIENEFNLDAFSKHFSYLRKLNNFTLTSLAKELDVTYQTISKWENKESAPNIYLMMKCAEIFNVPLVELYYGKAFSKKENTNDNKPINKSLLFNILGAVSLVTITLCVCIPFMNNNDVISTPSQIQIGQTYEHEMFSFTIKSNNTVILNNYLGDKKDIVIPTSITYQNCSFKVDELSSGILEECDDIEKLTIPFIGKSSVIDEYSYLGYLFGAESVEFSQNHIPTTLKELTIISSPTIAKYALYNCSSIEKITLPDDLKRIEKDAFLGCTNIKYNEYQNINYLGTKSNLFYALINVKDVTQNEYHINEDTVLISYDAFRNCSMAESIIISKNILYSCEDAFPALKSLKKVYYEGTIEGWINIDFVNFRSNPLYYGVNDFYFKDQNEKYVEVIDLIIPTTVATIKQYAFDGHDKICSVIIGENVLTIERSAFSYCESLTYVFIPNSVVKIGRSAFAACPNVEIYCEATSQPIGWDDMWCSSDAIVHWGASEIR